MTRNYYDPNQHQKRVNAQMRAFQSAFMPAMPGPPAVPDALWAVRAASPRRLNRGQLGPLSQRQWYLPRQGKNERSERISLAELFSIYGLGSVLGR